VPRGNRDASTLLGRINEGDYANGNLTGQYRTNANSQMAGRNGFDKTGAPVNYIMQPDEDDNELL